jgi:hypothetical protein
LHRGVGVMEEHLLCNFLTITIYVLASIDNLRKRAPFELTPPFPLENDCHIYYKKNSRSMRTICTLWLITYVNIPFFRKK